MREDPFRPRTDEEMRLFGWRDGLVEEALENGLQTMPGAVAAADVGTPPRVLPDNLCREFSHRRAIACNLNLYRGGESQVGLRVTSGASRLAWTCPRRLTADQLDTLRDFYETCGGPHEAFYFYDLVNHPLATYDATGTSLTGRFTARFAGPWTQTAGIGRLDVEMALMEIA